MNNHEPIPIHINSPLVGGVITEVHRRTELRPRLEAEMWRRLSDEEFLAIAERTGVRI